MLDDSEVEFELVSDHYAISCFLMRTGCAKEAILGGWTGRSPEEHGWWVNMVFR